MTIFRRDYLLGYRIASMADGPKERTTREARLRSNMESDAEHMIGRHEIIFSETISGVLLGGVAAFILPVQSVEFASIRYRTSELRRNASDSSPSRLASDFMCSDESRIGLTCLRTRVQRERFATNSGVAEAAAAREDSRIFEKCGDRSDPKATFGDVQNPKVKPDFKRRSRTWMWGSLGERAGLHSWAAGSGSVTEVNR